MSRTPIAAALVLLTSCTSPFPSSGTHEPTSSDAPSSAQGDAPEAPAPRTLDELAPRITAVGPASSVPRALAITFLHPAQPSGDGAATATLNIEPPVPGSLRWATQKKLLFTPSAALQPDTTYQVQLSSVDTRYGTLSADNLQQEIVTPPLALRQLDISRVDPDLNWVEVDLVYSAPIDISELKVSFSLDGSPLKGSRRSTIDRSHARYRLPTSPGLQGTLRVEASAAPHAQLPLQAPAAKASTALDLSTEPMDIKLARSKEGDQGYFIEVICHDKAVKDSRYLWDREARESWYLSRRCLLRQDALERKVHLSPPVPDLRIAGGRGGFRLMGSFERGNYTLRIDAGARTVDGGALRVPLEKSLEVGARRAHVDLPLAGRYLPRSAWSGLAVRHRNVDELNIRVRHIPRHNLIYWLSADSERPDQRTSDLILDLRVPVHGGQDETATTWVDLASQLPNSANGVYAVEVRGGYTPNKSGRGGRWSTRDTAHLLLTDLSLVAKADAIPPGAHWAPRLHAWALDMQSNAPVYGVEIEAVRPSGKVVGRCKTDLLGGCTVLLPNSDIDHTPPIALIARKDDDLTYLAFGDLKVDTTEAKVSGKPYLDSAAYRATLYSDRGVYRPGDTVHVAVILRDDNEHAPPEAMPVALELRDPRGKVVKRATRHSNASGMLDWDVPIAGTQPSGHYSVALKVADDTLASLGLNVESFVPERMKVEAAVSGEGFLQQASVPVSVDARYLFGASAEGSRWELSCRVEPANFSPASHANLHYGVQSLGLEARWRGEVLETRSGTLGKDGHGSLNCDTSGLRTPGPTQLVADVAVFEAGSGRTTHARTTVPMHPAEHYLGLQADTERALAGQTFTVKGAVVDWQGDLSDSVSEVRVELFRLESEWGWWWDDNAGEERFQRNLRPISEQVQTVSVSNGSFSFQASPETNGEAFVVRATANGARTDLRIGGSARYWWSPDQRQADQTPRPLKPTQLVVSLPTGIEVGESASAQVTAPWRGRLLWTVETHELVSSSWVDVTEPGPQSWSFTLPSFAPNAYVSALLIKDPHLESADAYAPERAFGVAGVRVLPSDYTMAMTLDLPDEVRSNSSLPVKLHLEGASGVTTVTVAAVDEGILSLTGFKSPDPIAGLFPWRALGVNTYETVGWSVMLPAGGPSSSTGGDEAGPAARAQPVKPVALWSGLVEVDSNGDASIDFEVPQYRGALRVMAVASSPTRVASAHQTVLVRDPLVLQTTLPRFLVEGDSFDVPVFVTNMSGAPQQVTVSLTAKALGAGFGGKSSDVIAFLGASEGSFSVADGESHTAVFQARALARVGGAVFEVRAQAGNLVSHESLEVPFEPMAPRTRQVQRLTLAAGTTDVSAALSGWLPTTEQTQLWVTNNPYGEALAHLEHLVHYPYGCIEQTTSSTRPLLFVSNLLGATAPELAPKEKIDDMVAHGISRVFSMQTASGGFAYWPGGDQPHAWGTAYGAHMLIDAKAAGYQVPQDRLDDALDWLAGYKTKDERYGNTNAYIQYVLARSGRGQRAEAARQLSALERRIATKRSKYYRYNSESRYLLQAALYLSGDRTYEAALRTPDASIPDDYRANGWSFYSERRRRALTLSIHEDLFGVDDAGGEALAHTVYNSLKGRSSSWYTTQELVWGVTALGRRISPAKGAGSAKLLAANKVVTPLEGGTPGDQKWALIGASEYAKLSLELPKTGDGDLYLMLNSTGVRANASWSYGSKGIELRREFVDGNGNAVTDLDLGDMVYLRVSLRSKGGTLSNVALEAPIPAGWEFENPRLGRGGGVDEIITKDQWQADYLDIRDGRVRVFGTLGSDWSQIVIPARATTSGSFTVPPTSAEAMYDPRIWSRVRGGRTTVRGAWDGLTL